MQHASWGTLSCQICCRDSTLDWIRGREGPFRVENLTVARSAWPFSRPIPRLSRRHDEAGLQLQPFPHVLRRQHHGHLQDNRKSVMGQRSLWPVDLLVRKSLAADVWQHVGRGSRGYSITDAVPTLFEGLKRVEMTM